MTDMPVVANLVAYSAQVGIIAAGGTGLLMLLRVHAPAVRYAYWRTLLALCLMLPWLQGRHAPAGVEPLIEATAAAVAVESVGGPVTAAALPAFDWEWLFVWTLVGGAALRLLWIGVSLLRLRRLRAAGEPAVLDSEEIDLQETIGTTAVVRYTEEIGQPATFGMRHPVVLLPAALRHGDARIRRAVLCHELFHVRRGDWAWVVAEEMVRAALWFHPGIWWLISRVQLAREERVDELAVSVVRSRRTYVRALLAFADETPISPAPAFGRKRHLFRRIQLIAKESDMSSHRVAASCLIIACTIAAGSWFVVQAFPLQSAAEPAATVQQEGPGPLERQAKPITPENPIPRRIHSVLPVYPSDLVPLGGTGTVLLHITIDASGRVAESRPGTPQLVVSAVSGDIEPVRARLSEAAQNAVRQWVYEPPAEAPLTLAVTFGFFPDQQEGRLLSHGAASSPAGRSTAAPPPPPPPPPPPAPAPAPSATAVSPTSAAASSRPAPAAAPQAAGIASSATPSAPVAGAAGQITPAPPAPRAPSGAAPVRVGGNVAAPKKVKDVKPVYPADAMSAKVQGIVILEATIDATGRVSNARVLRSIPLLDQAALDAVQQWEFTPMLLNGVPTPIIMSVTVNFTLTSSPPASAAPAPTPAPASAEPIRIGGNIPAPRKTRDMPPVYPAEAIEAQVSGIVIVETIIGTDGKVIGARVIRSIPLLDEAALAAVRQWEFTPTLLNGVPTPVIMSVTVPFSRN